MALTSEFWEQRYEQQLTSWDRGAPSPALDHWLEAGLRPPKRVLVPGCGNGYEVVELSRKGFEVVALDYVTSPLAFLACQLYGQDLAATLVHANALEWKASRPFDAVYEQTMLCALPPEFWPEYAQQLHGWLKPQGIWLASLLQTGEPDGPPYDCAADKVRAIFPETHWEWPTQWEELTHPMGYRELLGKFVRRP